MFVNPQNKNDGQMRGKDIFVFVVNSTIAGAAGIDAVAAEETGKTTHAAVPGNAVSKHLV